MKKTYMQPAAQVMSIGGKDALMESILIGSDRTEVNTSNAGVQLGREEEDFDGGSWGTAW